MNLPRRPALFTRTQPQLVERTTPLPALPFTDNPVEAARNALADAAVTFENQKDDIANMNDRVRVAEQQAMEASERYDALRRETDAKIAFLKEHAEAEARRAHRSMRRAVTLESKLTVISGAILDVLREAVHVDYLPGSSPAEPAMSAEEGEELEELVRGLSRRTDAEIADDGAEQVRQPL